ncbi:MAG: acetyl-CoA C-acetyltransferase [Lachnospirales bacterium]
MRDVYIIDAKRTPVGTFCGVFKDLDAVDLGVTVVKDILEKNNVPANSVDELVFGNVLQGGQKQNVARQIAVKSGLPVSVPAMTINKVCGSGLKTVILGYQSIALGENELVVAGGTESMTNGAFVSLNSRLGNKMGDISMYDTVLRDALTDAFEGVHMGITAERIAEEKGFTREKLDRFSLSSQNKAQEAIESGRFKDEISPVSVPQRRKDPIIVDTDEYPKFNTTLEGLGKLRPAFKKDGVITAGNASGINDGASAVILASKEKVEELGLKPMARIVSTGKGGVNPETMGYGPIPATLDALKRANLEIKDIDLIEANEAFAAQALAVMEELNMEPEKVNVNGGSIAIGHPVGASGTRILTTLLHEMKKREAKTGLATLCIGGGMGVSLIVELCN